MPNKNTNNLTSLKKKHINKVIKILTYEKECSRSDLVEKTGLSKMTISNIVTELIQDGIISEIREGTRSFVGVTGPKPMLLRINQGKVLTVGVYVGEDIIRVSLLDISFRILYDCTKKRDKSLDKQSHLKIVERMVNELVDKNPEYEKNIIGVGITSHNIYESYKGVVFGNEDYGESNKLYLREKGIQLITYISNEMQAAGIAEAFFGVAKKRCDFVYVGISERIGGTYITNNTIDENCRGIISSIGHVCVNYSGDLCSCGNRGCYEQYACIPVLLEQSKCDTFSEFLEKVNQKDPLALRVLANFTHVTDVAFTSIINVMNPECIVIGYEGAQFDKMTLKAIEYQINKHCISIKNRYVKLYSSALKEDANIWGAASIVFQHLFQGDLELPKQVRWKRNMEKSINKIKSK